MELVLQEDIRADGLAHRRRSPQRGGSEVRSNSSGCG